MIFVIRVHHEKLGDMLKFIVPKFCSERSARSKDIAEQVPAMLKQIAVATNLLINPDQLVEVFRSIERSWRTSGLR